MTDIQKNVERYEHFDQVCIWQGVHIPVDEMRFFEAFFKQEMHARVQFLEVLVTKPDSENGVDIPNTGGRPDILFAVHNDDIEQILRVKLRFQFRWIEDVLSFYNYKYPVYPDRVFKYISWDANTSIDDPKQQKNLYVAHPKCNHTQ